MSTSIAKLFKTVWLCAVAAFGLASIVATGGGDGDNGNGVQNNPPSENVDIVRIDLPRVALDGAGRAAIANVEITTRGQAVQRRLQVTQLDLASSSSAAPFSELEAASSPPFVSNDAPGLGFVVFPDLGTRFCRSTVAAGWACEDAPTITELETDGAGRVLALRQAASAMVGRTFSPTAGWSAEQTVFSDVISDGDQRGRLVYWSGGVGFAIAKDSTGAVRASRFLRSSEAWEPSVGLGASTAAGGSHPRIALARNAPAAAPFAAWRGPTTGVMWSRYVPGSGWAAEAPVPGTASFVSGQIELATSANGDALLLTFDSSGGMMTALPYSNGAWGLPSAVGPAPDVERPRLLMDGSGNGAVVWLKGRDVSVARFAPGSGWGAPVLVAQEPADNLRGRSFDADMDDSGRLVIVSIREQGDGTRLRVDVFGVFGLSVTPTAREVARNGASGAVDVTIARQAPFAGDVPLQVLDCPAKVICTLGSATLASSATATTLTFLTNSADPATAGAYDVRVQAVGGAQTTTATVRLTLTDPTTPPPPPPPNRTLTFVVDGAGRVVSTPAGLDCLGPQSCTASFASGTALTFSATPTAGNTFGAYGGAVDCRDGSITLTADTMCAASFNLAPPTGQWTVEGTTGVNATPITQEAHVVRNEIEMGADGQPVVAFAENNAVVVRRWNGSAWVDFGALPGGTVEVDGVSLAIDAGGAPVVAWDERDQSRNDGSRNVFAARWNGSAWTLLGGVQLDVDPIADAYSPVIRARSTDVAVAWVESLGSGGSRVIVRTWSGSAWVNAGGTQGPPQTGGAESSVPRLAVGPADELTVLWVEGFGAVQVAQLASGAWTKTASPLAESQFGSPIDSLDIAHTTQGLLVAAQPTTTGPFTVRRLPLGASAWQDFGTPRGSASTSLFGVAFSHNRTGALPLLAQARRTTSQHQYFVERFSGSDWVQLGQTIETLDRHGRGGFELRVSVVDAPEPRLATTTRGALPANGHTDDSVIVFRFH